MTPLAPSLSIRDEERRQRAGHGAAVVWITGLSGAGKTTLADALQRTLFDLGCQGIRARWRQGPQRPVRRSRFFPP
jgi:adenylylsulfate kinase-like enzyme